MKKEAVSPPVVVGVDFSPSAALALRQARGLAERLGARLEIVYVPDGRRAEPWELDPVAIAWLEAVGLDPSALVTRSGVPWVELSRAAEDVGAAIVVLGTHGASGFQPLRLGSNAARLAMASRCPVTLVNARFGRCWTGG